MTSAKIGVTWCKLALNPPYYYSTAARVVVWLEGCKPVCAGLNYKPIGCTSALSVTYSAGASAVAACGAI